VIWIEELLNLTICVTYALAALLCRTALVRAVAQEGQAQSALEATADARSGEAVHELERRNSRSIKGKPNRLSSRCDGRRQVVADWSKANRCRLLSREERLWLHTGSNRFTPALRVAYIHLDESGC